MKVLPFRKPNRFAAPGGEGQDRGEFSRLAADDFSDEIEIIRANESLMKTLEDRAKQPATITLHDVKNQIEIEEED